MRKRVMTVFTYLAMFFALAVVSYELDSLEEKKAQPIYLEIYPVADYSEKTDPGPELISGAYASGHTLLKP